MEKCCSYTYSNLRVKAVKKIENLRETNGYSKMVKITNRGRKLGQECICSGCRNDYRVKKTVHWIQVF